jgi:hypothetical protein
MTADDAAAGSGPAAAAHQLRPHARLLLDAAVSASTTGGDGGGGEGVWSVGLELACQTLAGGAGLTGPLGAGDVVEVAALDAHHLAAPGRSAPAIRVRCCRLTLRLAAWRSGLAPPRRRRAAATPRQQQPRS